MLILPIRTPIIKPDDDLAALITDAADLQAGDIIAVSSKAAATAEGSTIDLKNLPVSDEAQTWVAKLKRSKPNPPFRQAVLNETERLHGRVVSSSEHAMLTELKPDGFSEGSLMAANAGIDRSNVPEGLAVGWPADPVVTVRELQNALIEYLEHHEGQEVRKSGGSLQPSNLQTSKPPHLQTSRPLLAVLLTDSCCRPRRIGVTAIALAVAGFNPFIDHRGKKDLFGRPLTMTQEALADQLATAANIVMGNAAESTPAAIIRDHGIEFSDYVGWVGGIEREEGSLFGVHCKTRE